MVLKDLETWTEDAPIGSVCCLPGRQTYGHLNMLLLLLKDLISQTSKELSHLLPPQTRTVLLPKPLKTTETSPLSQAMVVFQRDQNTIVKEKLICFGNVCM